VIGRARIESPGPPPFRFAIEYDPALVQAGQHYVVRARITQDGMPMFTTDTAYPVLRPGDPAHVDVLLRRFGANATPADAASLENTYWKLVRLRAAPVDVAEQQREPHLILQPGNQRVVGFGGCNRLTGSYTLDGEHLALSQMAGTMMACPQGMEQESAFLATLAVVARWRVVGQQLELFDARGELLAQFESRYLK
jgi:putative lipoprotein